MSRPVVFAVAAGPRLGFGHLLRSRALARALRVTWRVCLRGTTPTRRAARRLGAELVSWRTVSARQRVALLVVDDPSGRVAANWVARARRQSVPVASVHDLGIGEVAADIVVDGSVHRTPPRSNAPALRGPAYAILDPAIATTRRTTPAHERVLIALGGGAHIRVVAERLCREIARRRPGVELRLARGFSSHVPAPALPHGRWIQAPNGLAAELGGATVAIVAGGVTLAEACAIGVPTVAAAVTAAQTQAIRALHRASAVVDAGRLRADVTSARVVAAHAVALLADTKRQRALSRRASAVIDGRGAMRVAARLRSVMTAAQRRFERREARRVA